MIAGLNVAGLCGVVEVSREVLLLTISLNDLVDRPTFDLIVNCLRSNAELAGDFAVR